MKRKRPPDGESVSEQIAFFLNRIGEYGTSLRQLANENGLDQSNLSKIARGARPASRTEIDAICAAMGWKLK